MYRVKGSVASNLWGIVGRRGGWERDLTDEGEADSLKSDIRLVFDLKDH